MPRLICLLLLLTIFVSAVWSCGQNKPPAPATHEVVVDRVTLTNLGFVLVLRAVEGTERIEMLVGFLEGQSIYLAHTKDKAPRPMTHDIFKTFLDRNGWKVDRVVVRDVVDGTFVADLVFLKDGQRQTYDARPSDSIALALRGGAKIFVADKVFEQQRREGEKTPEQRRSRPGIT